MAHGFAGHFEKLATPSSDIKYDSQYEELVSFDHRLLAEDVCSMQAPSSQGVTPAGIIKIIKSFKNNKAQDCRGLASEHLKFSPDSVILLLGRYIKLYTAYRPCT